MPKDDDRFAEAFRDEKPIGWTSNLLAEEDAFDRRTLWRLGSWGVASIASLVLAVMAAQSSDGFLRRDQLNLAESANRSQQVQLTESQNEARRLAAAVETLNKDRDRLYSRVTVLEQGLDSVTGSITRSSAVIRPNPADGAAAPSSQSSATVPSQAINSAPLKKAELPVLPQIAPVVSAPAAVTAPATSAAVPKMETPPDIVAALPSGALQSAPEKPVKPAEFGVDLGGANSIDGLRALWRGLLKSNQPLLGALQPIIVMKEGKDGLGMRLRLVAGPISDAATTAQLCAAFIAAKRPCETSAFDGQKLTVDTRSAPGAVPRKRPQPTAEQKPPPPQSSFSSIFGSR